VRFFSFHNFSYFRNVSNEQISNNTKGLIQYKQSHAATSSINITVPIKRFVVLIFHLYFRAKAKLQKIGVFYHLFLTRFSVSQSFHCVTKCHVYCIPHYHGLAKDSSQNANHAYVSHGHRQCKRRVSEVLIPQLIGN
jgi:hypothetical protein